MYQNFTHYVLGGNIRVRNIAQAVDWLPLSDPVLLSETSVKSAAEKMITKYGSHAWGMADAKVRSLAAEGLHSFVATWQQIGDVIGVVESRTKEME